MTHTEALRLALDALDKVNTADDDRDFLNWEECHDVAQAIKACCAALAAPSVSVAELVATELERLAQDPPISGNTLAQARVLMTAASVRQFGLDGGAAPSVPSGEPVAQIQRDGVLWLNTNPHRLPVGAKLYAAPQPAPAGWRWVPVEPTQAMLQDGTMHCGMGMFGSEDEARKVYAAMLAAAPAAPGGEG